MPGYPRYRLLGDAGSGVHHLEITNVTLEDEGRFQCQVSPDKGQTAIRADAYLTVLVKPRSVRLRAVVDGVAATDVVQVTQGDPVTLRCDVTGSRPPARVLWQRDGQLLQASNKAGVSEIDVLGGDTSASLTLRPSKEDNSAVFSCVAQHPAILPSERHLYNATVTLSVLYPPAVPVISGYTPGEVMRAAEQRTLSCFSEGGNPTAQLVWTKNGRPVSRAYHTTGRGASATYTFIADQSDLLAIYRCEATSEVLQWTMVAQVETMVQFGPQRVTITGTDVAQPGDTVHMTCVTSASNPAANLTWVVGGRALTHTVSLVSAAPHGGFVTISNVSTAVPAGSQEDMTFACYGQNLAIAHTRTGTATVTVLRPPDPPTILDWRPDQLLQAGERLTLSCLARGGSPPPRLHWYTDGRRLEARLETAGSDTISQLTLTVEAADNGRRLTCRSRSSAMARPLDTSTTLRVSFPPSRLDIAVTPDRLEAGGQVLLTCQSQPSLPAAHLTWWSRGHEVKEAIQSTETFPEGTHGGYTTRSVLRKRLNWTDNGVEFLCQAEMQALTGTLKTAKTLDVKHVPVFTRKKVNVTAVRNGPLTVNLTTRANPAAISYIWSREPAVDSTPPSSDGVLSLTSVRLTDAGWYRLRASNAMGSATARVHVDVLYPPEIIKTTSMTVVSEGEEITLACRAQANPLRRSMFKWFHSSRNLVNATTSYSNDTSFLKISTVRPSTVGEYECEVTNKLGYDRALFAVAVKDPANISKSARFAKAAAGHGETAHVTCRARGAPGVTFSWSRDGDVIVASGDGKYRLNLKQVDVVTRVSVLVISDVTVADFGYYDCAATNRLGSDCHTVQLVLPSVPDPPLELHVLNVSSHAVTLNWTPAFDGGFIQGFRFRYWEWGSGGVHVQDGDPNTPRFTIGRLKPDTKYAFTVAGYSQLGVGSFTETPLMVSTSVTPPVGFVTDRDDSSPAVLPHLLVGVASVSAVVLLLLLNALLVSCCYPRRNQKLRKDGAGEGCSESQTTEMFENDGGSISARSARSTSVENNLDQGDDCMLLPGAAGGNDQRLVFSRDIRTRQPYVSDVIEMTSPRSPSQRRSSVAVDQSYGYNHLVTSSTPFRDTLSEDDRVYTGCGDVIGSGDVTASQPLPHHLAAPQRRHKLVSFDDDVLVAPSVAAAVVVPSCISLREGAPLQDQGSSPGVLGHRDGSSSSVLGPAQVVLNSVLGHIEEVPPGVLNRSEERSPSILGHGEERSSSNQGCFEGRSPSDFNLNGSRASGVLDRSEGRLPPGVNPSGQLSCSDAATSV